MTSLAASLTQLVRSADPPVLPGALAGCEAFLDRYGRRLSRDAQQYDSVMTLCTTPHRTLMLQWHQDGLCVAAMEFCTDGTATYAAPWRHCPFSLFPRTDTGA